MRKVATAVLATPILLVVYAVAAARRGARFATGSRTWRAIGVFAIVAAVAAVAFGQAGHPATTAARPPSVDAPLPAAAFHSEVHAGTAPNAVVTMAFPAPMSTASVAAALQVEPKAEVTLSWDATRTVLTVADPAGWDTGRYHTITVPAGTLEESGAPIPEVVRASFLTRSATIGTIATAGSAALAPTFTVTFDRPVLGWTVDLQVSPEIGGYIRPVISADPGTPTFEFVPSAPLAPGTAYAVSLTRGALDVDGVPAAAAPLVFTTAPAPAVLKFRPVDGSKGVDPKQALSVRFSEPMDKASTQAAWSATQGGAAIAGTFTWTEGDTVLQFTPKAALAYAQSIRMTVGPGATSKLGVALPAAAAASFTTIAKPVVKPVVKPPAAPPPPTGGGTSVGSGTWAAVEAYYLKLMNCTRTGGWVSTTGSCSGAGSRAVAPLWQDMGISANVSRPYAKHIVIDGACSHFDGSTPAERLVAGGYTSYIWAENVGCGNGDPYAAMLADHLFFQAEASTNGGHYRNLMDAKFDRCGIGVWAYAGRVRLVVDFYHPL